MSESTETKFCTTLNCAIEKFKAIYPNKPQTISAINRFLLPSFGLKIKGSRMSSLELENAKALAKTIKIKSFNKENLLKKINETFQELQLTPNQQKSPRSHCNFFIAFLEQHKLIKNVDKYSQEKYKHYYLGARKIVNKSHIKKPKTQKDHSEKIAISFDINDYLDNVFSDKQKIEKNLERIKKDLDNFHRFQVQRLDVRKITADCNIRHLKCILGWIYQKEKDISKVDFAYIFPTLNIKTDFSEFKTIEEYFLYKGQTDYKMQKASNELIKLIENFFEDYDVQKDSYKSFFLRALINLIKYLYQDMTEINDAYGYKDILVIEKLRSFNRKLNKNPKKFKELLFTWEEILLVRDAAKMKADTTHDLYIHKRTKTAIARDLMKFLILCFFTVIPPDRPRTIRELTIGNTLKHGLYTKNGFIEYQKLENKNVAKFYLHLQPDDYKTGKVYGEMWLELYNVTFYDETTFYNYLEKWIYGGWRQLILDLHNQNHDYLFLGMKTGKPYNELRYNSFYRCFTTIFENNAGISLNPHQLRHIFCSYLDEIEASPKEKESIAFWMHHSQKMAQKTYTIKTLEQKLTPGFKLMEKISVLNKFEH